MVSSNIQALFKFSPISVNKKRSGKNHDLLNAKTKRIVSLSRIYKAKKSFFLWKKCFLRIRGSEELNKKRKEVF